MEQHVVQTDVDRYVIVEYLAEGGMGAIFLGKKIGMGGFEKEVVLKQLLPEFTSQPEFIDLFLREAKLSAALDHANIVHTIDLVKTGSDYFIVMEYVRGGDLRAILRRVKHRGYRIEPAAAIFIAREVLGALAYAHEKKNHDGVALKLIHRDVSPSNVMVSAAGEVKLADFGIAKASTHKSVFYRVKGKVGYMSPEQAFGNPLDLRSDLYSLAVCLHEMLVGERLFVADLLSTPDQIYSQPIPKLEGLPGVPRGLDRLMSKALAYHPDQRFQTALEFQDALVKLAFQAAMLFSAPDLATHLRKVCGDDASLWNREPDQESDPGRDRPGTEVLAEEASAQFSGVELTSVFTALPSMLGPQPAPSDQTRNLKLDPRGLAYEPTRLHLDAMKLKRSQEPSFDFSDLPGSPAELDGQVDEAAWPNDALGSWTPEVPPRQRLPERQREPVGWQEDPGDDQEPTRHLEDAQLMPHQEPEGLKVTGPVPRNDRRPGRAESRDRERDGRERNSLPSSRERERPARERERDPRAGREIASRERERARPGERSPESRDRDLRSGREVASRERARPGERSIESRDRDPRSGREVASRERARPGERSIESRERERRQRERPAPELHAAAAGPAPAAAPRRRPPPQEAAVVTDNVRARRRVKTQRLVLFIIGLLLLGTGTAIAVLVGLSGPSLEDKGTPRRDPLPVAGVTDSRAFRASRPDARVSRQPARADSRVAADLIAEPAESRGLLKVVSAPPRAAVYLDAVLQCETPCTIEELEDGRVYLLSIRRKNFVSWSSLIDLRKRRRVTVNAFLTEEPDARKVGYLLVRSSPIADIFVDGKEIGRVTSEGRIPLPPGQYEITLAHPQRKNRPRFMIPIQAGQTIMVSKKF